MCLCGTDRARETESGFSSQKGESGKCGKGWLRKTERRQRKEKELDQDWKKRTKMKRMERGRAGKRTDRRQMGQEDRTTKDREKFQLV